MLIRCADGLLLVEIDRVLKPGGYFVWTSPLTNARNKESLKRWNFVHDFAESICWTLLSQQDETVVWKKTIKTKCYSSRSVTHTHYCCIPESAYELHIWLFINFS